MLVRNSFSLLDSANRPKKRYKTRPLFDLVDFYWEKREGYIYLIVVTSGDREGIPITVYQIDGLPVELEKIDDLLYKYPDPEDEFKTSRTFEVEAIVDNTDRKTLQTEVPSDPYIYYFTSNIYPFYFVDSVSTSVANMSGRILTIDDLRLYQTITEQNFTSIKKITGVFKRSLIEYFMGELEERDDTHKERTKTFIERIEGILRILLMTYQIRPENTVTSIKGITGVLRQVLIFYQRYNPEEIKSQIENIVPSFATYKFYQNMHLLSHTEEYNPEDTDGGWTYITVNHKGEKGESRGNPEAVGMKELTSSSLDFEKGLKDRVIGVEWKSTILSSSTTSSELILPNRFDFYLDDMEIPLYTNVTEAELRVLLELNEDIEVINGN